MSSEQKISIVWLKRDLRLHDNEAIFNALQSSNSVLFLYVFENILLHDPHYSERHWNFVKQSLENINEDLQPLNTKVLAVRGEIISVFNQLANYFQITHVFSHQETGLSVTFKRDMQFKEYCSMHSIEWVESINNGVRRGLRNRENWFENWESYMYQPQIPFEAVASNFLPTSVIHQIRVSFDEVDLMTKVDTNFQRGGTKFARKYYASFLQNRYKHYMFHISKPEASRRSCSRLSPYIAWGNIAVREVFQKAKTVKQTSNDKKHLSAFISRLRWQAHFNHCILGKDYPYPIVDIKKNRKRASDILWSMREDTEVKKESHRIIEKHTIANRSRMLRDN